MEVFDILKAVMGIVGGGATGLIGSWLNNQHETVMQAAKNAHELALLAHERDMAQLEMEGKEHLATIQGETTAATAAYAADAAHYGKGTSEIGWMLDLVDVIRGVTRPVLTWALLAVMVYMWQTAPLLRATIADNALFITVTAITWWFGSRAKTPK